MRKSNKSKSAAVSRKRERRNRRSAARARQNHRTPVIKASPNAPDLFSRLSEKFRNNANWTPPTNLGKAKRDIDNYAVAMLRYPFEPYPRLDNRFVAVNAKTYSDKKDPLEYQQGMQQLLWQEVLDHIRPAVIDFVKSGGAIWDVTNLQPPKDLVESAVSVHDVDHDTYRAVNAALFTAYNTSAAQADLDTVAIALAAFIHAHPHFNKITDEGEFHQPFGEDTFWKLSKPFRY